MDRRAAVDHTEALIIATFQNLHKVFSTGSRGRRFSGRDETCPSYSSTVEAELGFASTRGKTFELSRFTKTAGRPRVPDNS